MNDKTNEHTVYAGIHNSPLVWLSGGCGGVDSYRYMIKWCVQFENKATLNSCSMRVCSLCVLYTVLFAPY